MPSDEGKFPAAMAAPQQRGTLDKAMCESITAKLRGYLNKQHGLDENNAASMYSVDAQTLLELYKGKGGPARWLQRLCNSLDESPRAADVFWSWISDELQVEGGIMHNDEPIRHPVLKCTNWGAQVRHRCKWKGRQSGSKAHMFTSLARRVEDWLFDQDETSLIDRGLHVPTEVMKRGARNLNDTFKEYGGKKTFWSTLIHLSLIKDVVGDFRGYDDESHTIKGGWMYDNITWLLREGLITTSAADRLLGTGKYVPVSPPIPQKGQNFMIDAPCGYMSMYFGCLKGSEIGYVCYDRKSRLWAGEERGWLRPHVCGDVQNIKGNPFRYIINQLKLDIRNLLWCHSSPPCTSFSRISGTMNPEGADTDDEDEKEEEHGAANTDDNQEVTEGSAQYINDVQVAKAFITAIVDMAKGPRICVTIENPAHGDFRKLPEVDELLTQVCTGRVINYCHWGFKYQKPTIIFTNMVCWSPLPLVPCSHRLKGVKHEQAIFSNSSRRVKLKGYTYHATVCRLPGGLTAELLAATMQTLDMEYVSL